MEKIVTEHQTMLALYHWGRTLQGKVGSIIPILIGSKNFHWILSFSAAAKDLVLVREREEETGETIPRCHG